MNRENKLIQYWAHMLDESSGPDLSKIQGTMTQVINDQVMDKIDKCRTVQDVYDLVKGAFDANGIDTEASRRLLYHVRQCGSAVQAMTTVHNSRMDGMNLGVGGRRRRRACESDANAADVKIVPDDDYESEAEYYSSLAPCQRKRLVRQSEIGLDLANGVYRPEQIINPELIPEARH